MRAVPAVYLGIWSEQWSLNEKPTVTEKSLTEEKKADIAVAAGATPVAAAPQAIPAFVDSSKTAAPVVLSQAPPPSPSDAKPVVDKASSVVASPLAEKK
jgi:hypothetical protein